MLLQLLANYSMATSDLGLGVELGCLGLGAICLCACLTCCVLQVCLAAIGKQQGHRICLKIRDSCIKELGVEIWM